MADPQQTYLGFDFGMKYIGIAVGQSVTRSATPLTTLKATNGQPDWSKLQTIIAEWQPTALVVGLPLNMDGSEQVVTAHAKRFANRLNGRFQLPVHVVDERLTTVEAKQQLFEEGGYKALQKTNIDSYAAKLILESWLNENL